MFVSVCFCRSAGLAHPHLSVIVLLKNCAAEAAKTRTIREWGFQVKHCSGDISGENGITLAEKEILFWEKRTKAGEKALRGRLKTFAPHIQPIVILI